MPNLAEGNTQPLTPKKVKIYIIRVHSDKKKVLLRSGVVPQIVATVFNIMAEETDPDEEFDEDEVPVSVHAGFIIQSFAMNLSAQVCARSFHYDYPASDVLKARYTFSAFYVPKDSVEG